MNCIIRNWTNQVRFFVYFCLKCQIQSKPQNFCNLWLNDLLWMNFIVFDLFYLLKERTREKKLAKNSFTKKPEREITRYHILDDIAESEINRSQWVDLRVWLSIHVKSRQQTVTLSFQWALWMRWMDCGFAHLIFY